MNCLTNLDVIESDDDILHVEDNLENEISDGDKVTSDLRDKENELDEDEVYSIIPGSDTCTDKDEAHKKIKQLN